MNEREIFQAALACPDDAARRAYLDSACAADDTLRHRVETLLRAYEVASLFLERPIVPAPAVGVGPTVAAAGTEVTGGLPLADEDEADLAFLQPSDRPGSLGRLAHYEVLEVVGRGGFGTVVRAFDEKLHRMVAIKVMARGLAATSPPRKRFLREARAAAAIRHEHAVSIHAVDEQPIPYLVMEYIAGQTLQAKLDEVGPIAPPEVLRIGIQIAAGLAAAHRQGLIHRDIKPANILLEAGDERVKITDFGLARTADDASLTQSGLIAGTPMYMAPEQALGATIDQRADLFSLGSVLYVMCTGRPPFRAPTTLAVLKRVAEDAPRPIREVMPEVPADLCALIARLHAKDPADRFASAEEVVALLREQLAALRFPPGDAPTGAPPRSVAPPKPGLLDSEFFPVARRIAAGKDDPARPAETSLGTLLLWAFVAVLILVVIIALKEYRGQTPEIAANPVPSPDLPAPTDSLMLLIIVDDLDVDILVTGEGTSFVSPSGTYKHLFSLPPGRYRYSARRDGRTVGSGETLVYANQPLVVRMFVADVPGGSAPTTDLASWGRLIDPLGGSRVTRDGRRLSIAIPGNRHRHLNPMPWFNVDAPRVLQPVSGDFSIRVTQRPSPRPGPASANKAKGEDGYQWGGLVVWADEKNFLRFGVGALPEFNNGTPFLDLKLHHDAKMADEVVRYTSPSTTHLRVDRRGDTLTVRTSPDGTTWADFKTCNIAWFPRDVQVGVAAINCGIKEVSAEFRDWSVQPLDQAMSRDSNGPVPPAAADALASWGSLIDPTGGSRLALNGARLTLTAPGDRPRDLNPKEGYNRDAPRVFRAVAGDFTAQVKVLPFAGPRPPSSYTNGLGSYHGAGLVVWLDDRNFVRFERAGQAGLDAGRPYLNLELFVDGQTEFNVLRWADPAATYLQVERRGNTLIARTSDDGRTWADFKVFPVATMPGRVEVGVTAINSEAQDFAAEFEDWSLRAAAPLAP